MKSREVQLISRPDGMPSRDDFKIVETETGDPRSGEVVIRNLFMSVDPYMRGRMRDGKSYVPPFQIGKTMDGGAVGQVVVSESEDLSEGDYLSLIHI